MGAATVVSTFSLMVVHFLGWRITSNEGQVSLRPAPRTDRGSLGRHRLAKKLPGAGRSSSTWAYDRWHEGRSKTVTAPGQEVAALRARTSNTRPCLGLRLDDTPIVPRSEWQPGFSLRQGVGIIEDR